MSSPSMAQVAELVELFFRRRGEGRRVSVDEVLAEAGSSADAHTRLLLIQGISRAGAHMSRMAAALPAAAGMMPEISGYDVIDEIGRGGMGVVFEAYQQSTGRRVAVKVLSEHLAGGEGARRRFEREVELVARLQHPHIVSVVDSGLHQGRYFYVMEFVEGVALNEWWAAQYLSRTGARRDNDEVPTIRLLADICDAVEYAHQRGVLHRDLKPTNILVDKRGQPHILDFGLAKDIGPLAEVHRAQTLAEPGQILGTLAYMAPEQARGAHDETSVRSDVYALGAIGYEAVTGRAACATDGALHAVLERIQHEDPAPPSSLRRALTADIDAILMKALNKAPARRYATAGEMAGDLRRYLAGETVSVRVPGGAERLWRLARRHRALAGGVAATLVVLVLGIAATSRQAQRARVAERAARAERDQVRQEAGKAQAINAFLQSLLVAADPDRADRSYVTVRDVLDAAAKRIESELTEQPEVEAALRSTIGLAYANLGLSASAEPHLETALEIRRRRFGEMHRDVASSLYNLSKVRADQARFGEAEVLFREAMTIQQALGDESELATRLGGLALLLHQQGMFSAAEPLYRQALAQQREHPEGTFETANIVNSLGLLLCDLERLSEAESLFHEALALWRGELGAAHPRVASALNNLGMVMHRQGRLAEAEVYCRDSLELRRQRLRPDHPAVAESMANLAIAVGDQGRLEEAEALHRAALELRRRSLGGDHPDVAASAINLAIVLKQRGAQEEAESLLRESLEIQRRRLGEEHFEVIVGMNNLASFLLDVGRLDEAETLLREAIRMAGQQLDDTHWMLGSAMANLAVVLEGQGELEEAEHCFRRALASAKHTFGAAHVESLSLMRDLGALQQKAGRPGDAETTFVGAYEAALDAADEEAGERRRETLTWLLQFYTDTGQPEKAEARRRALAALGGVTTGR